MKILWAITGAGHLLKESIHVIDELSQKHEITIALSNAGLEVVKKYGYMTQLEEIRDKKPENMIVCDEDEKYSYPLSGKITHEKYDLIIVSPTTANTTAKIVHAIADTLVTNIVAQSGKGRIPLLIVPVDQKEGIITTKIPPYIKKDACQKCEECKPGNICPKKAINPPNINTIQCINCMKCRNKCPHNALITDKEIELYIRKIDAENTAKLEEIENIKTIFHPEDILEEDVLN